ncbi:nucleotide exchange factor GrpE [Mangrovibacterium diazotrophicum]|uniref:Protein GrpE n=1 Tax=Mangrovibacterium diazotrophicum TaxID=1261403 RepID=A0A419W701_9BACT|nr:nucleotide exchange factor GrpE [Mangrovibacterium diazotrophicum]RKD91225.1 molecular chaperone GrpE [Mangrovibacterium diazotrophicum]
MAEEKVVNEQENGAEEITKEQKEAPENTAKHEDKHDKKSKKDKAHDEIEKLQNDLADMKDKHIRLQAEFDNFRKRTLKEKMELMKSGGESVLMNIIPVIDDLERALVAFRDVEDENPLKQGVTLIYNKFQEFLKQNGIKEIEAKEKDFDTDLHEAITKIPAPTEELKGKVVDVIQKGYLLHEKVIRFAKVVIGE